MKSATIIYTILSIISVILWIPDKYFGWMMLGFLIIDHIIMIVNPFYYYTRLIRIAILVPHIVLGMLMILQYLRNSFWSTILAFITLVMFLWVFREFIISLRTHYPDKQSIEIAVKREGTQILFVGIYLFLVGLVAVIITSPVGKSLYYCLVVTVYGLLTFQIAREFVNLNRRRLFILIRTILVIILGLLYRGIL